MDKKEILEIYTSPTKVKDIKNWTEEECVALLLVLEEAELSKDLKSIQQLCQLKLNAILSAKKKDIKEGSTYFDVKEFNELSKKYRDIRGYQKETYERFLEERSKEGEILRTEHVFSHTQAQDFGYQSGTLLDKVKFSWGMSKMYAMKDYQLKGKAKDWDYLKLDPENIKTEILDFFKNKTQKKHYNELEKMKLKIRCLENQEICKNILSSAKPLLIPEEGTQEGYIPTERIVALYNGEEKLGYLVSEHSPIKYAESHLNKYRGDIVRFEIFETREKLEKYLREQIKEDGSMNRQHLRFQDALFNFKKDDEDELRAVLEGFKKYNSYTDQEIIKTIQEILDGEKRGLKQKIEALREKIKKGMQENRRKKDIMDNHFIALRSNNIF